MRINMNLTVAELKTIMTDHVRKEVPNLASIEITNVEVVDGQLLSVNFYGLLKREEPTR